MLICPRTVSEARVGTSLQSPTPPNSISCLPSATTPRKTFVPSGLANLSRLIGELPTRLRFVARQRKSIVHTVMRS